MVTSNPQLIWISPGFWMVVIYGGYLTYTSGYKGVMLSLRSGRLKTLGKTYAASGTPRAYWRALVWNGFIALAGGMMAAMMLWDALSAEASFVVLSVLFFGCVLTLSEFVYRFAFRALLTGVIPGKATFYRRDRQPKRYWGSIFFVLSTFLFFLIPTCGAVFVW